MCIICERTAYSVYRTNHVISRRHQRKHNCERQCQAMSACLITINKVYKKESTVPFSCMSCT